VKYELGFYIPEDDILHSHSRENLKSYILKLDNSLLWQRVMNVINPMLIEVSLTQRDSFMLQPLPLGAPHTRTGNGNSLKTWVGEKGGGGRNWTKLTAGYTRVGINED
jgi:hypothetical protein